MPEKTLLETYVVQLDKRFGTLEDNVQKLSTIVNKICNDQAVFDFKQEQNVRVSGKLEEMVSGAREKLESVSTDFVKECDKRETKLLETLNAYKLQVEKVCQDHKTAVDSKFTELEGDIKDLQKDVKSLQRWLNLAIGGGSVLIFIVEVLQNGGFKALGL